MAKPLFKLYIAGETLRSLKAVRNLRRIIDEHLDGQADAIIIDIMDHPAAARAERLLAIPTLVRERPLPMRRVVGDLSDISAVLEAFDLESQADQEVH